MLASSSRNIIRQIHPPNAAVAVLSHLSISPQCPIRFQATLAQSQPDSPRNAPAGQQPSQPSQANLVARTNLTLLQFTQSGSFSDVMHTAARAKQQNFVPNIETYEILLTAARNQALPDHAWAIYEDMKAMGIKPTATVFECLLGAHRIRATLRAWPIIDEMHAQKVIPNLDVWKRILAPFIDAQNLEMTFRVLAAIKAAGFEMDIAIAESVIVLATKLGNVKIAVDTAVRFEAETSRQLPLLPWMACLQSSAHELYAEGIEMCWERVIDMGISLDEGLCMDVLHTAARNGLPELGIQVIAHLRQIAVPMHETHFAPLVEAFCRAGRVKEAIQVLSMMRENDVAPLTSTGLPIVNTANVNLETFDATFAYMEEIHKNGDSVDVSAIHVMIRAAVALGDLQRAIGAYQSFDEFLEDPEQETFELLLDACIQASHRELGDKLLEDMQGRGIEASGEINEKMALLYLTQSDYDDAFPYLEEAKAGGRVPSAGLYQAFAEKLASTGDPRLPILFDEMRELNLPISQALLYRQKEQWPTEEGVAEFPYAEEVPMGDCLPEVPPHQVQNGGVEGAPGVVDVPQQS